MPTGPAGPDDETLSERETADAQTVRVDPAAATMISGERVAAGTIHDQLGDFPVTGLIGAGGMGEILRVADRALMREVAAKVIRGHAGPRQVDRFVVEAQITGQLEHPGIPPVHTFGRTDAGEVFFTMKEVHGRDLETVIDERTETLPRLLEIFLKICDAVAFAHSRGVIHRDLKPANIMVGQFGEVLVMDWGLAKAVGAPEELERAVTLDTGHAEGPQRTMEGAVVGTPAYMPPEQADGRIAELDARTDVYSLGAILYHLLAGAPPFEGTSQWVVIEQVLTRSPIRVIQRDPTVPWELDVIVGRAMAREADQRYQDVRALREDIEAYLDDRFVGAARYTPGQRVAKYARRNWRAVSVAVAVIAALGWYAWSQGAHARALEAERDIARQREEDAQTARRKADDQTRRAHVALRRAQAGEAEALIAARRAGWQRRAVAQIARAARPGLAPPDAATVLRLRDLALSALTAPEPTLTLLGAWTPAHPAPIRWASGGRLRALTLDARGNLWLWDARNGSRVGTLTPGAGRVLGAPVLVDDRWVWATAVDLADGAISAARLCLWDVRGARFADRKPAVVHDIGRGLLMASAPLGDGRVRLAVPGPTGVRVFDVDPTRVGHQPPAPARTLPVRGPSSAIFCDLGAGPRYLALTVQGAAEIWHVGGARRTMRVRTVQGTTRVGDFAGGRLHLVESDAYRHRWLEPWGRQLPPGATISRAHDSKPIHAIAIAETTLLTADSDGLALYDRLDREARPVDRAHVGGATFALARVGAPGDRRTVLAGGRDGTPRLWRVALPAARRDLTPRDLLRLAAGELIVGRVARTLGDDLAIGPSRRLGGPERSALAARAGGARYVVAAGPIVERRRLDAPAGAPAQARVRLPHGRTALSLAVDRAGRRVAIGDGAGLVHLWTGEVLGPPLDPGVGPVDGLWWSADGRALFARGAHGLVRLALDGAAATVVLGRDDVPDLAAIDCRGARMAHAAPGGIVVFRDANTGRETGRLVTRLTGTFAVALGPRGERLATAAPRRLLVWEPGGKRAVERRVPDGIRLSRLAYAPDGRWLAGGGAGGLACWDIQHPRRTATMRDLRLRYGVARIVLGGPPARPVMLALDGTDRLLRVPWKDGVPDGKRGSALTGGEHLEHLWALDAHPSGDRVVSGDHQGLLRIWDARTLRLLKDAERHPGICWTVDHSPDGARLAVGGAALEIRDAASGAVQQRGPTRQLIAGVAWHPKAALVAAGAMNGGGLRVWDVATGAWAGDVWTGGAINDVAFDRAGRWLAAACGDGRVRLWDLGARPLSGERREPDRTLGPLSGACWAVTFSADGALLLAGTERGVLTVFAARDGFRRLATIELHTKQIRSLRLTDDGRRLLIGCYAERSVLIDVGRLRARLRTMGLDWK